MPLPSIRRAVALAAVLSLAAAAVASADTIVADGDAVTPGIQGTAFLGELAPGDEATVEVPFRLACRNTSHAAAGSVIELALASASVPLDGAVVVEPGTIGPVPGTWPVSGESCPGFGEPALASAVPARVTVTAPSVPGTGYELVLTFERTPSTGITGFTSVSFTFDVVVAAAADGTPPVLAGVPESFSVVTDDPSGTAVWFPLPSAVDDVDPSPAVACDPEPGSHFAPGTSPVTCTATDATGNRAAATFEVTVRLATATFVSPLSGPGPLALNPGRTLPVKASLSVEGTAWTPASGAAPRLVAIPAASCQAGAPAAGSPIDLGPMDWDGSRWRTNMDTTRLPSGCARLALSAGDGPVGAAMVRLQEAAAATGQAGTSSARSRSVTGR